MKEENAIIRLTFNFAVQIVIFCEILESNRKYVLSKQLQRSGTSIGANIREAQNSESKLDFIHKVKIALKEVEETEYWLEICQEVESYPNCKELLDKLLEIRKVLSKIISTSKSNLNDH